MKKFLNILFAISIAPIALFAEDAPASPMPSSEQGLMQTLVMIGIALVFFYIILWRPEQKRRKAQEDLRKSLKKGDKVTAMGIIGTVYKVEPNTIVLKMVDGSKIEFLKAAISDVIPGTDEDAKKIED